MYKWKGDAGPPHYLRSRALFVRIVNSLQQITWKAFILTTCYFYQKKREKIVVPIFFWKHLFLLLNEAIIFLANIFRKVRLKKLWKKKKPHLAKKCCLRKFHDSTYGSIAECHCRFRGLFSPSKANLIKVSFEKLNHSPRRF